MSSQVLYTVLYATEIPYSWELSSQSLLKYQWPKNHSVLSCSSFLELRTDGVEDGRSQ